MKRIALSSYLRLTVALCALLALGSASLDAQERGGSITGRVVEAINRGSLPGALVIVVGTTIETTTDFNGAFRVDGVPPGTQTVLVSYLGYGAAQQEVTVEAGQIVNLTMEMTLRYEERVEVRGQRSIDAQASALNKQFTAPNITNVVSADQIGNFPDPNAAEATQRIPGISIQRDQGEGRYVLIRGTEARLNSMTINGERIPAPEGELRTVAIDVIPTDLLQAVEVSKALTPDMDADAIGGSVNLVLKEAPEDARLQFTLGTGYNDLAGFHSGNTFTSKSYNQLNGAMTAGRRFMDSKLGLLISASASSHDRNSENFEAEYDDGELDELQNRYYELNRQRNGINGAIDYRASENSTFFVNGIFNYYRDYEYRWRERQRVGNERIERDIKDRESIQKIFNLSGGGQHFLGSSGTTLDYKLSFSRSGEVRPDELLSVFRQKDIEFAPNVTPDSIDPNNIRANPLNADVNEFEFDTIEYNSDETRDRDVVASANLLMPLPTEESTGFMKFGFKYRNKNAFQHAPLTLYESEDDIMLTDVLGYQPPPIINGRYTMNEFQDVDTMRSLYPNLEPEHDPESDAANYDAQENVAAGYAMTDFLLGSRFRIMGGLRYEHTSNDSTGYEVIFDEEGEYQETVQLENSTSYGQLLPMVHLKYNLAERSNLRLAFTRTLARPNYYQLVPFRLVSREDNEIEQGNPDIRATTSWNFDALAEHYFESVGVVSGGFFYKRLDDFIYAYRVREVIDGERWDITEPRNGPAATIAGFEVALQTQLVFLPSPFDGFGIYANYTFSDSEAEFPGREGEKASLPGQSRHVGNLAFSYEKRGFSARLSLNFHGKYIDEVGVDTTEDIFYDNHTQLDLSVGQALSRKVKLFADFVNLNNEPLRYYFGVPDRPIAEEYYRWWGTFGVKVNF